MILGFEDFGNIQGKKSQPFHHYCSLLPHLLPEPLPRLSSEPTSKLCEQSGHLTEP